MSLRRMGENLLAWVDTRRSAVATIKWLTDNGITPKTLVDAGANNSQWMRRLARRWPYAKVISFEPQKDCHPIGTWHSVGLGSTPGYMAVIGKGTCARLVAAVTGEARVCEVHRLEEYESECEAPVVLKVDCEDHTYDALAGAGRVLDKCACVVAEVWEGLDAPCVDRNKHAEMHALMWEHGFNRAMTVGAMPWRNHVSITDVLWWRGPC